MDGTVKIFVEGTADKKFLEDYIGHIIPDFELHKDVIIDTGGWTNIYSQKGKGESIRNRMKLNTDNDGINLMIFDADNDYTARKAEIEKWKNEEKLEFELFLFPNDRDSGALENLLERIITPSNSPIFDCWEKFENCLQERASECMGKALTIPARKSKIYVYLEALLGKTRDEKEKAKDPKRDYKNTDHWDLNADDLQPLKKFLNRYFAVSSTATISINQNK